MSKLGQCKWCPWDCPSPDVAACREPDPDAPPVSKPRKWVEDILPDIATYEEAHDETAPQPE